MSWHNSFHNLLSIHKILCKIILAVDGRHSQQFLAAFFSNKFLLCHFVSIILRPLNPRSQLKDIQLIPIWKSFKFIAKNRKRLKNNWKNLPVTFDELPSIFSTSFFYLWTYFCVYLLGKLQKVTQEYFSGRINPNSSSIIKIYQFKQHSMKS